MNGVLLVDKPKGPTSHDVVAEVRRLSGEKRCGHTGTLDPFATGLLVMCFGPATRLSRFLTPSTKTYRAQIYFGYATDTYDATGAALGPPVAVELDPDALRPLLRSFVGEQQQAPPPFSAKKVAGRRLYELARAGEPVAPKPVAVVVHRLELLDLEGPRASVEVEVGSGTYIRSLAHDLGRRWGSGAHLEELRRTRVGIFSVEEARSLVELGSLAREGNLAQAVISAAESLGELPLLRLRDRGVQRASRGAVVGPLDWVGEPPPLSVGQPCRLVGPRGDLVAVGTRGANAGEIRPLVVLNQA